MTREHPASHLPRTAIALLTWVAIAGWTLGSGGAAAKPRTPPAPQVPASPAAVAPAAVAPAAAITAPGTTAPAPSEAAPPTTASPDVAADPTGAAGLQTLVLKQPPAASRAPVTATATAVLRAIDIPALIECRGQHDEMTALSGALIDPLQAVALGWRPRPSKNMFLSEFTLPRPITVFGETTDHVALGSGSLVAVLDLADPHPLAKRLQLETAYDAPGKAMFGLEVRADDKVDAATSLPYIDSAVVGVSTVATHPGQVLAGCTYSKDAPAE